MIGRYFVALWVSPYRRRIVFSAPSVPPERPRRPALPNPARARARALRGAEVLPPWFLRNR